MKNNRYILLSIVLFFSSFIRGTEQVKELDLSFEKKDITETSIDIGKKQLSCDTKEEIQKLKSDLENKQNINTKNDNLPLQPSINTNKYKEIKEETEFYKREILKLQEQFKNIQQKSTIQNPVTLTSSITTNIENNNLPSSLSLNTNKDDEEKIKEKDEKITNNNKEEKELIRTYIKEEIKKNSQIEPLVINNSKNSKQIAEIYLDKKSTTDSFKKELENCDEVESLFIKNSETIDFEDKYIPWNKFENLKQLTVKKTSNSASTIGNFIEKFSSLKTLILWTKPEHEKNSAIAENINWQKLKDLEKLNLSGTKISDATLEKIAKNCIKLKELDVSFSNITHDELNQFLEHCTALEKLNLDACDSIKFEKLNWAKTGKLTKLNLSDTKINFKELKRILNNISTLEKLDLRGTTELKEKRRENYKNSIAISALKNSLAPVKKPNKIKPKKSVKKSQPKNTNPQLEQENKKAKKEKTQKKIDKENIIENIENQNEAFQYNRTINFAIGACVVAAVAIVGVVLLYKKRSILQDIGRSLWQKLFWKNRASESLYKNTYFALQ